MAIFLYFGYDFNPNQLSLFLLNDVKAVMKRWEDQLQPPPTPPPQVTALYLGQSWSWRVRLDKVNKEVCADSGLVKAAARLVTLLDNVRIC